MTDAPLPAPPVPPDADLRHFLTMPLHVQRLRDSDLAAQADPEVRWANLISWCAAWHQLPAGSLPDDDTALCRLLGYGRDLRRWRPLRAKGALRGWYRASDGRLYHPIVASMALECLAKSRRQQAASRARWHGQNTENQDKALSGGSAGARSAAMPGREGKGIEGIETPSTPSPNGEGSEGASPASAGDPPAAESETKLPRVPPEVPRDLLLDMVAAWNEMAANANLPQVKELNDRRARALRARIRERWAKAPLKMWQAYLDAIEGTPFLVGDGSRRWRADFDWAIRPTSILAVAEGKYRDEEPT